MTNLEFELYKTKRRIILKFPRFGSELARAGITFRNDLKYKTAATDGKDIFIDPGYFTSLSNDDRVFLVAHEFMHNKFKHMLRLRDKNGEMRDLDVWNYVCDAIINANLEKEGFKIKEGYVNYPDAVNYSAEELYEIVKEQQNQQPQNDIQIPMPEMDGEQNDENGQDNASGQNSKNQNSNIDNNENIDGGQSQPAENQNENNESDSDNSNSNKSSKSISKCGESDCDATKDKPRCTTDHSMWEDVFKKFEEENSQKSKKEKNSKNDSDKKSKSSEELEEEMVEYKDSESSKDGFTEIDEKKAFQENHKDRVENNNNIKNQEYDKNLNQDVDKDGTKLNFGNVGVAKPILDWKMLLKRELEKDEDIWSQRRSIAENNYAYRLEEFEEDDEAITEVLIDVSGSVSNTMVKNFLRQLKPLLRESKLKVGTFNEFFWGMQEIKKESDIDNFTIPKKARTTGTWTEDWDLAVRSFSKDSKVNKIVFTDGEPCPGTMPKSDLKNEQVYWLVYSNRNFSPCCGKVIQISESELNKFINGTISKRETSTVSIVEDSETNKNASIVADYISKKKSEKEEFKDMFDDSVKDIDLSAELVDERDCKDVVIDSTDSDFELLE